MWGLQSISGWDGRFQPPNQAAAPLLLHHHKRSFPKTCCDFHASTGRSLLQAKKGPFFLHPYFQNLLFCCCFSLKPLIVTVLMESINMWLKDYQFLHLGCAHLVCSFRSHFMDCTLHQPYAKCWLMDALKKLKTTAFAFEIRDSIQRWETISFFHHVNINRVDAVIDKAKTN